MEGQQIRKENRFYLRYHNSITRAIELNKQIFGQWRTKDDREYRFEHSLRVAGHCQQILDQTMLEYHQCWLLGILHDNKQVDTKLYNTRINYVLQDLFEKEQEDIKHYVNLLTPDPSRSKGERKRYQVERAEYLPLIPSWILLFDKMDNVKRFKNDPIDKSKEELNGYYAVAYLIYRSVSGHHRQIEKFLLNEHKEFFENLGVSLGGTEGAKKHAETYFKLFS